MRRGYLTRAHWDALLAQQGGVCIVEGCESTGPFHGEHSNPNYFKPGKPDQLMCVACHKIKTRKDKRAISRAKRLNGETLSQYERRMRFGPALRSNKTFHDWRREKPHG